MSRCLKPLLLTCVLLALAPPATAADVGEARATAAVQVTSNPAPVRGHSSPQIARNPTNGELVIAEADIGAMRHAQFTSPSTTGELGLGAAL